MWSTPLISNMQPHISKMQFERALQVSDGSLLCNWSATPCWKCGTPFLYNINQLPKVYERPLYQLPPFRIVLDPPLFQNNNRVFIPKPWYSDNIPIPRGNNLHNEARLVPSVPVEVRGYRPHCLYAEILLPVSC